jgi:hypothetical protein
VLDTRCKHILGKNHLITLLDIQINFVVRTGAIGFTESLMITSTTLNLNPIRQLDAPPEN